MVLNTSQEFDLRVSVARKSLSDEDVDVEYAPPQVPISQALFTSSGFACLGVSISPSTCASGSALDGKTALCADGSPTRMRGVYAEMVQGEGRLEA